MLSWSSQGRRRRQIWLCRGRQERRVLVDIDDIRQGEGPANSEGLRPLLAHIPVRGVEAGVRVARVGVRGTVRHQGMDIPVREHHRPQEHARDTLRPRGETDRNPKELEVLGDGNQRKSHLLVEECVDGMMFGYENAKDTLNYYNLRAEDQIAVKRIVGGLVEETGLKEPIEWRSIH